MNVEAVIGANYGDEGKGLFTDYLCANMPDPIVVLTNGGSQRGHTVELENGTRHVFHHFGSGTFRDSPTYFPKPYLLNPMQFVKEYDELQSLGYTPKSFHHPDCILQLPCDIALNWHLEKSRGQKKHGSVGCGIWETKYRLYNGDACTFDQFCKLNYKDQVNVIKVQAKKYRDIRCKEEGFSNYAEIYDLFMSQGFIDHFISDCLKMKSLCQGWNLNAVITYQRAKTIVFECGQGLKLDQFYGANDEANTTPSFTGAIGVANVLNDEDIKALNVKLNYISRTYLTKHGAGKFDEEKEVLDVAYDKYNMPSYVQKQNMPIFEDKTNVWNEWQDSLRFTLLNYCEMLDRCSRDVEMFKQFYSSCNNITRNIVMTHANEIPINEKFNNEISFESNSKFSSQVKQIDHSCK